MESLAAVTARIRSRIRVYEQMGGQCARAFEPLATLLALEALVLDMGQMVVFETDQVAEALLTHVALERTLGVGVRAPRMDFEAMGRCELFITFDTVIVETVVFGSLVAFRKVFAKAVRVVLIAAIAQIVTLVVIVQVAFDFSRVLLVGLQRRAYRRGGQRRGRRQRRLVRVRHTKCGRVVLVRLQVFWNLHRSAKRVLVAVVCVLMIFQVLIAFKNPKTSQNPKNHQKKKTMSYRLA